jgi:exodeoxyribonuclease VII large subunit
VQPGQQSQPTKPVPATAGETTPERPWPVRLLSARLNDYLAKAPSVWLEGQIVQVTRRPGQNWVYLTLRDPDVDMSFDATVSRRVLDALATPLADGARVVVHAKPSFYARRGSLSLALDQVKPVGIGELLARIEHLRRVLAAEGLFDPERKKPLPFLPNVIGLVCGRASAAERDVVENARRRWPGVRFEIREVAVQGPTAVAEVVAAVQELDRLPAIDVIVITRGGGSLEDLLPFSNEAMVRVVAECRCPIVSAIGHEVDNPLLDLVADLRASTPTDAAKRIVPDMAEELLRLRQARERTAAALAARLNREGQVIEQARERAMRAVTTRIDRARDDIRHLAQQVHALSPAATLDRGYAVVQAADGSVIRDPAQVAPGDRLRLRLSGGELAAAALASAIEGAGAADGTGAAALAQTSSTEKGSTQKSPTPKSPTAKSPTARSPSQKPPARRSRATKTPATDLPAIE